MGKKENFALILLLILLSSVFRDLLAKSDPFAFNRGYSLAWFIVVYIIGAYIRKHVILDKCRLPGLFYTLCCVLMFVIWITMNILSNHISIIKEKELFDYWTRYNSLLNILASISLFIFFLKKTIQNNFVCKLIKIVSPLTLGVYLLHDNPYLSSIVWIEIFKTNQFVNDSLLILKVFGVVASVFVCCLVIDFIRKMIFELAYKRRWFISLCEKIDILPFKLMNKINE